MNNREIIAHYYRTHHSDLLFYTSIRLHDAEEAADMVQEVFLRLLSEQQVICEATIDNLAHTLCRHRIVDWYRRRAIRADVAHELIYSSRDAETAESLLSIHDLTEQLEQGLACLSPACQDIYRLHVYGGMKAQDICLRTGEKYKHVEYLLGVARKHIRNYLRNIS